MRHILLILLLLTSFGMAEKTDIPTQEVRQETPKNLQDLGRGYAKDPKSNQIYYEGKLIDVYSPKTFTAINKENENGYDAEDYYTYYKSGFAVIDVYPDKAKVALYSGPNNLAFDYALNAPAKCVDDKDIPADLLKCYQKYIPYDIWSKGSLLNPDTFTVLDWLAKSGWVLVTDGHRVIGLTAGGIPEDRMFENFSIDNIDDFSTFEFVGRQRDVTILSARDSSFSYGYGLEETMFYNQEKKMWDRKIPLEEVIQWQDSMTLKLFYFKDKKHVYANQLGIIEEADPETFELLTFPYAKDKDHIFYYGKILQGANQHEFEILDYRLKIARDKTKVFYKDHILNELDIETFKLINTPFKEITPKAWGSSISEGRCPIALLMDSKSVYYVDVQLSDEPEYAISLSIKHIEDDENKYQPDRLYGMASLPPFLMEGASIEILRVKSGDCRIRSTMGIKSNDSLFFIGRIKDSLYVWDMIEDDLLGIAPP